MELWSTVFLEEPADWATATVSASYWRRITEEQPDARRLIGRMEMENGQILYCALGTPIALEEEGARRMYLPPAVLSRVGAEGTGQRAEVEWLSEEAFPEATRIVLRPHDSAFYHADAKEELERALTRLGVVEQGTTVLIPLSALGDYEVAFDVVRTEPANIVLAQGDEVALEFEEALDAAAVAAAAAVATAPPPQHRAHSPLPFDATEPMFAAAPAGPVAPAPAAGQILGGGSTARYLPDGRRWNPWRDGPWTGV